MISIQRRPDTSEYAPYYRNYVAQVKGNDVIKNLNESYLTTKTLLEKITHEQSNYKYAPDKWTVKEVALHMVDVERVMAFRALTFARQDNVELPGFDDHMYVTYAKAYKKDMAEIISTYTAVRQSSIMLFESFDEEDFNQRGTANEAPFSVLALAYIIVGHEMHHRNILHERYLHA